MNKNNILSGGGKNLTGGGKWGWRRREVGGRGGGKWGERGREVGIGYPPVHPLSGLHRSYKVSFLKQKLRQFNFLRLS